MGSFMPWVTVSSVFGSISKTGIEGDGAITLIIGAILAVLGFVSVGRARRRVPHVMITILGFLFSGVVIAIAAVDWVDIGQAADVLEASDLVIGSAGTGLFVTLVGGVGGAIASIELPSFKSEIAALGPPEGETVATDTVGQLERLENLHQSGGLSDAEFAAAKRQLLGTEGE